MAAGGAAERLAVAGLMGTKVDAGGRRAEQGRKAALALGERHGGEGLAVELEEIEQEIDEAGAVAVGGLLHEGEVGDAVGTHGAEFAVEISGLDGKFCQGGGCCGIFGGPVEPGTAHPTWVAPSSAARFTRSERRASFRSM